MIRISRRAISAVAGTILMAAASGAASAHVVGGGPGLGGLGGHGGGHHFHAFSGPYFTGFDDGYDGCGYLRYKARETGRPYWWRRYHACLDG